MRPPDVESLLPAVFQRTALPGSPLTALVEVMSALQEPAEQALRTFPDHLSAYRTPDAFVPYLASWVDLDRLLTDQPYDDSETRAPYPAGVGRLRELVVQAARHSAWRGTHAGLVHLLVTATGVGGFAVEEPAPFRIRVRVPAAARAYEPLVRRVVESEKPAAVSAEVVDEEAGPA
jgi:phage tail-like protein